jgi:ATP-dependent Clp protease ATP-binding subunit ClpA
MKDIENYSKSIIGEIMKKIKQSRTKNKQNHEYITLEEFFFYGCEFKDVQNALSVSGMKADEMNIFKDLLSRYLSNLKKIEGNEFQVSEGLDFILRSVSAISMNMDKEISFKDVLKVILTNKSKEDGDKCLNIREILSRFNVALEPLLEDFDILMPNNYDDDYDDEEEDQLSRKSDKELTVHSFINEMTSPETVKSFSYAIGREECISDMIQGLNKKKKSSVLLVGHPGVGKNAIVESFALSLSKNEIPSFEGYKMYEVNLSSMVGGSKYRGDFEKKFNLLETFVKDQKCILFIDEIHVIQNAGATGSNDLSMGNLLKPMLATGQIKLIGATTYEEKRKYLDKDQALVRRFETVNVEEVKANECVMIIEKSIEQYEKHHGVKYQKGVIQKAVDLSVRYITDRKLPDKVFDIIDTLGAINKSNGKKIITEKDVDFVIAKMAHVPVENISNESLDDLLGLSDKLNKVIFGQENAVEALTDEIMIAKSNIGENGKRKPLGSFMFAGPTGVGKTEITNELGKALNMQIVRLDMSEYMEKHTVSKLIGSPPGYKGSDESSALLKKVASNPYSIVLFDEFEKAHSDVQNLLLQLLDNGFMTDSTGKEIDFRSTIVIITTNAGANVANKGQVGFMNPKDENINNKAKQENVKKELERMFKPEFRNRLDHIIYFNSLTREMAIKITNKKLKNIEKDMKVHHNIIAKFDEKIISDIANTVFEEDNRMGARPIDRKIKQCVAKKLSVMIIKKLIKSGDEINITMENGEMSFSKKELKNKDYISKALAEINI